MSTGPRADRERGPEAAMDLKTEATARAMALKFGVIQLEDLAAWADTIIAEDEDFDPRLIDVSLANSKAQATSALNAFGWETDKARIAGRVCGLMRKSLESTRGDYRRIAKALYDMAMDDYLPGSDSDGSMWEFWDALDLALDGLHGDPAAIKAEMLKFLADAAEVRAKA